MNVQGSPRSTPRTNAWFFALFDADERNAVSREEWRLAEHHLDEPVL